MAVEKTIVVKATCDLESCGKIIHLDVPGVVMCTIQATITRVGNIKPQNLAFCSKEHCNAWWNNSTGEPLIP